MLWDLFTESARLAIYNAQTIGEELRSQFVGPEEILKGILRMDCDGTRALREQKVDIQKFDLLLNRDGLSGLPGDMALSTEGVKAIEFAANEMRQSRLKGVTTLMLVLGCIRSGSPTIDGAVERLQISQEDLRRHLMDRSKVVELPLSGASFATKPLQRISSLRSRRIIKVRLP